MMVFRRNLTELLPLLFQPSNQLYQNFKPHNGRFEPHKSSRKRRSQTSLFACSGLNYRANDLHPVGPEQLCHAFRRHSSSILPDLRQFAKELLDRPGWL